MTNDLALLSLSFVAGVVLGAAFFGGLWFTVRRGLVSKRPALWFLVSSLLRTSMALAGLYLVAGGDWKRLLACTVGFSASRPVVRRLTRPSLAVPARPASEAGRAP